MKHIGRFVFLLLLLAWPARASSQSLVCPDPGKDVEQNKAEARRYFELGTTYFNMDQFGKSAEAFACVIKLVPYTVMARYRLAVSYDRLGKLEPAKEQYRWVLASTSKEAQSLKAEVKKRLDEILKQEADKAAAIKAEADRKAKAEAEAKAKAEAEARARQEALAKAEAERIERIEAERKAKEDAWAKAEADKKAKAEANRKALEAARKMAESNRKAKAEADRKAKEDARLKAEANRTGKAAAGTSKDPPGSASPPGLTSRWWFWTGLGATLVCAGTAAAMGGVETRSGLTV